MKEFHIGSLAFALGAAASLALAIPTPASAQSNAAVPAKLYADSKFVATDRISVEIVGPASMSSSSPVSPHRARRGGARRIPA